MINLNNILDTCDNTTVGGVHSIYFARRSSFDKWFYEETAEAQNGRIVGNQVTDKFYPLTVRLDSISYDENISYTPTRQYDKTLSFSLSKASVYNRDRFEQWAVLDDIAILWRDNNDKYWLLGESKGTRMSNYNLQVNSDDNFYEINLNCVERFPIREVSAEYANTLIEPDVPTLCDTTFDVLCNTGWSTLCEAEWGTFFNFENALTLDGMNDYVSGVDSYATFGTTPNPASFTGWFYPTSLTPNRQIIAIWNFGALNYNNAKVMVYVESNGSTLDFVIELKQNSTAPQNLFRISNLLPNRWYNFAWTKTGQFANDWTVYLNGVQRTPDQLISTALTLGTQNSGGYFGVRATDGFARPFEGYLDEFIIQTGVISAAEVAARYNGGSGAEPTNLTGLLSRYKFDSDDGDVLVDETGTYDGKLEGYTFTQLAPKPNPGSVWVNHYTLNP